MEKLGLKKVEYRVCYELGVISEKCSALEMNLNRMKNQGRQEVQAVELPEIGSDLDSELDAGRVSEYNKLAREINQHFTRLSDGQFGIKMESFDSIIQKMKRAGDLAREFRASITFN